MKPNQFVFEGRQKTFLMSMMVIGVVSMLLAYVTDSDPLHTRFWTNYLHNSVFFTGIAMVATFLIAAKAVALAGWQTVVKRIWEAYSLFLIVGLVLMGVLALGVWGHFHHLYHWADAEAVANDKILKGKSSFLNAGWYSFATFGFIIVWYWFARKFRSISLEQDEQTDRTAYPLYTTMKKYSAIFLPIFGFTSAAAIWQWVMSVDAHWYSTLFAWYCTASLVVTFFASVILLLIYFKSKGYFQEVTLEHFHDLGKFVFGISVFWTYLWFSQYMLIWYGNIGEETIYFKQRMTEFPIPFWSNIVMNFILPFLILIRNDAKRKTGILVFTCSLVIFGHWNDLFQMTKYGPLYTAREHNVHSGHGDAKKGEDDGHSDATTIEHGKAVLMSATADTTAHKAEAHATETHAHAPEAHATTATADTNVAPAAAEAAAHHDDKGHGAEAAHEGAGHADAHAEKKSGYIPGFTIPGFYEIGTFIGFIGLFLYFVFSQLAKAPLVPKNDPYLNESLNHHV
jgi:hypothetical protein